MVHTCEAMCKSRKACSVCELARALVNHGWSMIIAALSTRELREQGCKSMWLFIRETKNWCSCECFLVNYISEGDSQKFLSANDFQYTACV